MIFPRRLGDDLGREMLFSAHEFKGRELAQRGMPLPVLPAAEVLPRALAVAHRLARRSRPELLAAKAAAGAGKAFKEFQIGESPVFNRLQHLDHILDSVHVQRIINPNGKHFTAALRPTDSHVSRL